jgi:hypothetical protein
MLSEEDRFMFNEIDDLSPTADEMFSDNVNHPMHYTQGAIECIDALEAALGREGLRSYCRGACMKYLWRTEFKNGVEDLRKCAWYLQKLIEISEEES